MIHNGSERPAPPAGIRNVTIQYDEIVPAFLSREDTWRGAYMQVPNPSVHGVIQNFEVGTTFEYPTDEARRREYQRLAELERHRLAHLAVSEQEGRGNRVATNRTFQEMFTEHYSTADLMRQIQGEWYEPKSEPPSPEAQEFKQDMINSLTEFAKEMKCAAI